MYENRDDNRTDDARRQIAAENLARRRSELRKNRRSSRRFIRYLLPLMIILLILLLLITKCLSDRITGDRAKEKAAKEQAEAAENSKGIVIGLKGSSVQMVLKGDPYIENGAFAIDRDDGAINEKDINIKGNVDTSEPGDYDITYSVRRGLRNYTAVRTVRVLDEEDFGGKAGNVPVAMYHWVYTEKKPPKELDANWIRDDVLDEQMAYLEENNFYYPGWKELRAWIDGEISLPEKCVVITFDDGKKEFLKNGIPVLERHHVPATSFMICGGDSKGAEKIKEYASPYVDFESHSYAMHQPVDTVPGHKGIFSTMSKEEILADLATASEITGTNDAFAYPYGDYTDVLTDAVREQGIICAFTTEYDRVRQGMDPLKLPRIRVLGTSSLEVWKGSIY